MPRYLLARLKIDGFRGINNHAEPLDLRFKTNAINSVFGTNGLGKSSIFDALSYAIRGCIPKLDDLPDSDGAIDYYCNLFHPTGTATLNLTLSPDDGSTDIELCVTRTSAGQCNVTSPSGYAAPEQLLRSLSGDFVLLDQGAFQRFVDDSPLKRGRTFSGLLGLSKLSEYRQALAVVSNRGNVGNDFHLATLETQKDGHRTQLNAAHTRIRENYLPLLGAALPDPMDCNNVLQKASVALSGVALVGEHFKSKSVDKVDFDAVRKVIKGAEMGDERQRLSNLIQSIASLAKLAPGETEATEVASLGELIEKRADALAKTGGAKLESVYSAVASLLESGEWEFPNKCPACDAEREFPILDHVNERLSHYETANECLTQITELWTTAAFVLRTRRLESLDAMAIPTEDRKFDAIDSKIRIGAIDGITVAKVVEAVSGVELNRTDRVKGLEAERDELEGKLPQSLVELTTQVERAAAIEKDVAAYKQQQKQEAAVATKLERRTKWQEFIKSASDDFSEAEVALSTATATAVESDYREMYGAITNNPDVVPALRRAGGSEELHLRLEKFYTLNDRSASTLLQESYRNALAISIFLSTALKSKSPARFIVFDDITSSFDAGHQFALMELLRTRVGLPANNQGPQVILLSHDGLLEKYFDKLSGGTDWHHQRLQGSPPCGAVLSQSQDAGRLKALATQLLTAGQIDLAEHLVRQYLEYMLLQIISKVRIPVPLDFSIRDDRKMVDNALGAIKEAVDLCQQANVLVIDPTQSAKLMNIIVPAMVANSLSHYATGVKTHLTAQVLSGLLQNVDDFSDCFCYDCQCSGSTQRRYYKSLTKKHCPC
ncbi:AAA family ATPase [Lacipirellula sp.]|uniref:AAA family ATPase n=1 Tax=Lacipirellula sp. TaxID=2691419 RepID=UPI003D0C05B6